MIPGGEPDRAEAMARRLARTALRLGVDEDETRRLVESFRAAMGPRRARIDEDHHPDYLHPARTALILMDDCRVADPLTLRLAVLAETRRGDLALGPDALRRLDPEAAELLLAIPDGDPADERLLERLLELTTPAALVAVAERLDHARHLHLRPRDEWGRYHRVTCEAYVPFAPRSHPALARRLAWWCDIFRTRYLGE